MMDNNFADAAGASKASMSDLMTGMNEWRNIQDVVRLTLKSFHDALKSQQETISELSVALEQKVGKEEFLGLKEKAMQSQEQVESLDAQVKRIEDSLVDKPDRKELLSELQKKVTRMEHSVKAQNHENKNQIMTAMSELQTSVGADLKSMKTQMRAKVSLERFRAEMETRATVSEIGELLDTKVDRVMLSKSVEKLRSNFNSELVRKADKERTDRLVGKLEDELKDLSKHSGSSLKDIVKTKADTKSVNLIREVLAEEIQLVRQKQHEMELRIDADSQTAASAFKSISSSFDTHITDLQQIVDEQSFGVTGLKDIMEHRIAATQGALDTMKARLEEKVDMTEMEKLLKEKADLATITSVMNDGLEQKASKTTLAEIADRLDRLQLQTDCRGVNLNSTTVEDICSVLDRKANTGDINSVSIITKAEMRRGKILFRLTLALSRYLRQLRVISETR